jgi:hypothetical protein
MGGKTSGLCFTTGDGFSPCPLIAFSSCRESVVGPLAEFIGAALIGPTALAEYAGSELASGEVFRAVSPFEPLLSGLLMGLADGLDSIVGDEFKSLEGTFAKDSEYRVFSLEFSSEGVASSSLLTPEELSESMLDRLVAAEDGPFCLTRVAESASCALRDGADGLSERDSSVSCTDGFTAGVLNVSAAGRVEVPEVTSSGRSGSAGDVASTASIDFWGSRRRFPSGPRPPVSPTAKTITANKNATAAS